MDNALHFAKLLFYVVLNLFFLYSLVDGVREDWGFGKLSRKAFTVIAVSEFALLGIAALVVNLCS